jgi:membrane protease YdiL (CAAX protease family)
VRNSVYLAAIVLTIGVASRFAFDISRAGSPSFYFFMAVPTVLIAGLGVARAKHDGVLKDWLAVRGGDFTRGFVAAAALFGATYGFSKVITPPTSPRAAWLARIYLQLGDPAELRKSIATIVFAMIVMAVAEELVWRGLVIGLLEEKIGSRRAWVWAAVLYALAHAPTAMALSDPTVGPNPLVVAAALLAGLVWGGMARRYERLLPGVFSHVLFDWTVLIMFRLWGPSV